MNALMRRLYGLTETENLLVEKGQRAHQHDEKTPRPPPASPMEVSDRQPRGRRSSRRLERTYPGV
jgi:hypothetical protein